MGNVDLPLIAGDTGIEAALKVMQGLGRSGLVTTRNDTYVVLTDEDLNPWLPRSRPSHGR